MKRLAFALSLVAATAFAAPLAAQGPWYDPNGTGQRTNQGRVDRNGNIYDNSGVYNRGGYDIPADGRWHRVGTDRQGRTIYMRERYDSYGNLVQEAATRNWLGQYHVIDSRVVSNARNNGRYDRGTYGNNGRYDSRGRDRNDRWDQNNGHDNGRHNGQYKRNDQYERDRIKYEQEQARNRQKYEQAQQKTREKYEKKARKH